MDTIAALAQQRPLIALHLAAALLALLIGAAVIARPKGTFSHKTLGWTWVTLMAATSLSSFFIRDRSGPNIAGFTPIHFFTAFVAVQLPSASGASARAGSAHTARRCRASSSAPASSPACSPCCRADFSAGCCGTNCWGWWADFSG